MSSGSPSSAAWVNEAVDDVEGVGTVPDSLILAIISCVTTGRSSGMSPPYWPLVSLSTLDPHWTGHDLKLIRLVHACKAVNLTVR